VSYESDVESDPRGFCMKNYEGFTYLSVLQILNKVKALGKGHCLVLYSDRFTMKSLFICRRIDRTSEY
jgi:hypothetical protein